LRATDTHRARERERRETVRQTDSNTLWSTLIERTRGVERTRGGGDDDVVEG